MKTGNTTLPRLLELIDRYFDCSLSDSEELQLRNMIAHTGYHHPAIDEARALMGFKKPVAAVKSRDTRKLWWPAAGVAAAIAVMATIGFSHFLSPRMAVDSTCIAYINGKKVTDEDAVLRQLTSDMREFGDCAVDVRQDIQAEIDEAFPMIDSYESDFKTEN